MTFDRLYFSAGTDAVDAALITKATALQAFALNNRIPLGRIAAIGDSSNDIPLLSIPRLGLAGAPANAQSSVKRVLSTIKRAFISEKSVLAGFAEFYAQCEESGIQYVFADRDGVLVWSWRQAEKRRLRLLFARMGLEGRPFIIVITGSSYEQNVEFMREYRLDSSLSKNRRIRERPCLIYAENGALQVNILNQRVRKYSDALDKGLLRVLKNDFRETLLQKLEQQLLPKYSLEFSRVPSNRRSTLSLIPKQTMVTLNLPKRHLSALEYRYSAESDRLRVAILEEMASTAHQLGLPYEILGDDASAFG
ncbi:MAG: HAD hydrolase family protein [Acidobacteria bacterium]|nr:HAD hydrolase family protein [Acidobacteriota bacterium]